jgi:hypothetical protein
LRYCHQAPCSFTAKQREAIGAAEEVKRVGSSGHPGCARCTQQLKHFCWRAAKSAFLDRIPAATKRDRQPIVACPHSHSLPSQPKVLTSGLRKQHPPCLTRQADGQYMSINGPAPPGSAELFYHHHTTKPACPLPFNYSIIHRSSLLPTRRTLSRLLVIPI